MYISPQDISTQTTVSYEDLFIRFNVSCCYIFSHIAHPTLPRFIHPSFVPCGLCMLSNDVWLFTWINNISVFHSCHCDKNQTYRIQTPPVDCGGSLLLLGDLSQRWYIILLPTTTALNREPKISSKSQWLSLFLEFIQFFFCKILRSFHPQFYCPYLILNVIKYDFSSHVLVINQAFFIESKYKLQLKWFNKKM